MHLLSRYSLSCGVKPGNPFIIDKYYPLPFTKYITFQPFSKQAKSFDFWQEVLDLILPILNKENIKVIQIGGANEKPFLGCYHTQGGTSVPQAAYLIKNSILHLGADSFGVHFASSFKKKIVALYSTNYISCVGPYWSNYTDIILLEPDRKRKPSFALEENPKSINLIKPEKIAESVCKLLNLEFKIKYKSLGMGFGYSNTILETLPNQVVDPKQFGAPFINIRMDFIFNEQGLIQQLNISPSIIVTDRPITEEILKMFKGHINELYYEIKENSSPEFVKLLNKYGIKYVLFSYLEKEKLDQIKLNFMDFNLIANRHIVRPEIIKDKDLTKIFYKSNKFTLSEGKIYPSYAAVKENLPISNFQDNLQPIIDSPDFWKEAEYFYLLEKVLD